MIVEAYPCVWFKCPHCFSTNTLRFGYGKLPDTFECSCGREISALDLLRLGRDFFNPLAAEFMCPRCRCENTVFTKVIKQENKIIHPEPEISIHLHAEGGAAPLFGLCESCFSGYDLHYPQLGHIINPNIADVPESDDNDPEDC